MWSASSADFDLNAFVEHCRTTKPPFECPYDTICGRKTYRSFIGIEKHLNAAHELTMGTTQSDKMKKQGHNQNLSPTNYRGAASFEQAQRFVDVDINGNVKRININAPLTVRHVRDTDLKLVEQRWKEVDSGFKTNNSFPSQYVTPAGGVDLPIVEFCPTANFVPMANSFPDAYVTFKKLTAEEQV